MKIECMTCFMDQAVKAAKLSTGDFNDRIKAVKAAADRLSELDYNLTPPEIATEIFGLISRMTDNPDAYSELKQLSNRTVKELFPEIGGFIGRAKDPFAASVVISLCGNIIDYGILENFDVGELIRKEIKAGINSKEIEQLRDIVEKSRKISFIADNAGEIGLDGIMLDEFRKVNPELEITVFVRSRPIINDATMADAEYFGLNERFTVMASPGTVGVNLETLPECMMEVIEASDFILSKGQANYEILSDSGRTNIIFLLRAKCPVVSESLGVEQGSPVLKI